MYKIVGTRTIIRKFDDFMNNLPKDKYNKILHFLKNTPNGHQDHKMKFKKVGRECRQYDLTEDERLIYGVLKKEKEVVLGYIGSHEGADIYLRKNC